MKFTDIKILQLTTNDSEKQGVKEVLTYKNNNVSIIHVQTINQFEKQLKSKLYDFVISSSDIQNIDGKELYKKFLSFNLDTPFIFIFNEIDDEKEIELLKLGVADCISIKNSKRLPIIIERILTNQIKTKKLLEKDNFLAGTLNSLSGHIAVIDKDGVIIETNTAWNNFAKDNAASNDSMKKTGKGSNYFDVVKQAAKNDNTIKEIYKGITQVAKGKLNYFYKDYDCHSLNEKRWYTLRVTPLQDSSNIIISHDNITDRVLAEKEVLNTYNKLELIANNIGEVVYKIKLTSKTSLQVEYISNNVKEIIGYDTEDYINGNPELAKSMKPDKYEEAVKFNQKVRSSTEVKKFIFEYEWFHPIKQEWIWLEETLVPEIQHKKVIGQFGKVIDITERKKYKLLIKKTEEKYKKLFSEMKDGLLLSDEEGKILMINPAFCNMLGYKENELIGKVRYDFLIPDNETIRLKNKFKTREKGLADNYETEMITKHGERIIVNISVSPQFEDGKFIGVMALISDITKKKKLEEIFEAISNTSLTNGGEVFFTEITNQLCKLLDVKYAFIGKKIKNKKSMETLGFSNNGKTQTNFAYELKNTPCKITLKQDVNLIESNLQNIYPLDDDVKKMKAESYLGISLKQDGENIGIIALLDDKPMQDIDFKNMVLYNIKSRTETEIKRFDFENLLLEREERFRSLIEFSSEITCIISVTEKIKFISPSVQQTLGYAIDDIKRKKISNFIHPAYLRKATSNFIQSIKSQKKSPYDLYLVKSKNEGYKFFRAIISNHTDKKGIEGLIINAQDVTEYVKAEKDKFLNILNAEQNERTRIAHDLHDGLGQTIAAANMSMNALATIAKSQLNKEAYTIFETGKKLVNQATKETRIVSHNIMPRSLKEFGLEEAVQSLINNYKNINSEIIYQLKSNLNNKRFNKAVELTTFRVIQEALNNATKYSKSQTIDVSMKLLGKRLIIDIQDEGIGFDTNEIYKNKTSGLGLSSMSDRINTIDGKLIIKSTPQKGTKVLIVIRLYDGKFQLML